MLGVRARTADPLPRAPHVVHNPEGVCDVAGAALAVSARLCTAMHSRPRVPRLPVWDTPGFTKKLTSEQKAMKRLSEIKNGRLAMIGMVRPAPRPAPSPCLPPSTCRGPQPVAPLQRQPTPGRVLHTLTLTLTLTLTRRPSAPRWPSPAPCRCSRALPRSRAPPSPCPSAPSKLLARDHLSPSS